ncbi:MAG: energy transducer TonB, partial [Myxococcales bacterium]
MGLAITAIGARALAAPSNESSVDASAPRPQNEPAPASSDDAEHTGALAVIPPRPLQTRVEIPKEIATQVNVLLELLIDHRGHVEQARVLEGPEPFAQAALDAAPHFLFEPARTRGHVSAAKIRFLVRFEPKQPAETPPTTRP